VSPVIIRGAGRRMADQNVRSSSRNPIIVGGIAGAFGLYFLLVGFGLLPVPSHRNGPAWLETFAGVAFLFAGLSVVMGGLIGSSNKNGELSDDAPLWAKALCWLAAVAAAGSLAAIATWIAFGGGQRGFNMAVLISGPLNEGIGRALFGLSTIFAWFITIALAQHGARKIFGKKG
jgi:hypothetical protein